MSPAQLPEGFLIASAEDMPHYAIAQLNDGRYGETSILSPQGIAELHAPATGFVLLANAPALNSWHKSIKQPLVS